MCFCWCVSEIKNHILCSIPFFFLNHCGCEIMWKNITAPGRPQMKYSACALHAGYLHVQIT